MTIVLLVILIIVLLLLALGYAAFFFGVVRINTPADPKFAKSLTKYRTEILSGGNWFRAQGPQRIELNAYDGLRLVGYFLPAASAKGTLLLVHGYRSSPFTDFGVIYRFFHSLGWNILAVWQRSHGESEGKYITFGVKERYDIAAWAKVLSDRHPDLPLFLYGQSMGGATVIMAAGLDLPKQTRGVIADSAFHSPRDVIATALINAYKVPVFPMLPAMDLWARIIAGYSLTATTCREALDKTDLPFLFIHGKLDELVPYDMGYQNYVECHTEREMLTVETAAHCACCYVDPVGYMTYLDDFLKKYTK